MTTRIRTTFFQEIATPSDDNYFELLTKEINDISNSSIAFYQKVISLHALSSDLNYSSTTTQNFYKSCQNRILSAVSGLCSARLLIERSNINDPNFGLHRWKSDQVKRQDIQSAYNYLNDEEAKSVDGLIHLYFVWSKKQAQTKKVLSMSDYEGKLHELLNAIDPNPSQSNLSKTSANEIVKTKFEQFLKRRIEASKNESSNFDPVDFEHAHRFRGSGF